MSIFDREPLEPEPEQVFDWSDQEGYHVEPEVRYVQYIPNEIEIKELVVQACMSEINHAIQVVAQGGGSDQIINILLDRRQERNLLLDGLRKMRLSDGIGDIFDE